MTRTCSQSFLLYPQKISFRREGPRECQTKRHSAWCMLERFGKIYNVLCAQTKFSKKTFRLFSFKSLHPVTRWKKWPHVFVFVSLTEGSQSFNACVELKIHNAWGTGFSSSFTEGAAAEAAVAAAAAFRMTSSLSIVAPGCEGECCLGESLCQITWKIYAIAVAGS